MLELVTAVAPDELLILPIGKVRFHGIDFSENFLSELVAQHLRRQQWQTKPMFLGRVWHLHTRKSVRTPP